MTDYNIYYKIHVQAEAALKAFSNIEKSLKNIAKYSSDVSKGLASVSGNMNTLAVATNAANKRLEATTTRLQTLKTSFREVKSSFNGFWSSLIGFSAFKMLVQPIYDFEGAMARVRSVVTAQVPDGKGNLTSNLTSLSPIQLNALRQQAMKLGSTTLMNDVEVAKGQVELAKLGMSYQQILAVGGNITKLSIAGDFKDMGKAATTAAVASNIFGTTIKDVPNLLDSMARTFNTSTIKATELQAAFSRAGGAAKEARLNYNQFLATLGAVNQKIGNTAVTSTGLKSAFTKLLAPNRNTLNMYRSLGIDYQKSFAGKGLIGVLENLHDKTKNLQGTTRYFEIMKNLFGIQSYVVGSTLVNSIDDVKARIKDLGKNAKGALDKINDTLTQNNLQAAFRLMKARFVNADLALGRNGFTGTLIKVITILGEVGRKIGELNPNILKFAGYFILVAGALSTLNTGLFIMRFALTPVMALFKGIGVIISFINVIWDLVKAMRALTMAEIMADLANPALWILGIGAAITVLTLKLTKLGEVIKNYFKNLMKSIYGTLFSNKGMYADLEKEIKNAKKLSDKLLLDKKNNIIAPTIDTSKLNSGMDIASAILSKRYAELNLDNLSNGVNNKVAHTHDLNSNKQRVDVHVHSTGSVTVSTDNGKTTHVPLQIATSSSVVGN